MHRRGMLTVGSWTGTVEKICAFLGNAENVFNVLGSAERVTSTK